MHGPGSAADSSVATLEPITLSEVQHRVLAEDELLLDLYLGPEVSLLLAVTKRTCRVIRLPAESELEHKIRSQHEMLAQRPQPGEIASSEAVLLTAGEAMGDLLLADLDDLITASRWILYSPDAVFNLLPLAAMLPAGTELAWSRIPSATILARLRKDRASDPGQSSSGILALVGGRKDASRPLFGARREAQVLVNRFKGVEVRTYTRNLAAQSDSLSDSLSLADLARYEILHLAAHTAVNDETPWQSSVILPGFGSEGRLAASSIATNSFDTRLAVLAACESGGGRILSGEGVLGLTSAFLSAGVPAVVATLWPVDDAITAQIMSRFYDELAAGHEVGDALQIARQVVRNDPATSHPFFWAGYTLVGDAHIKVALQRYWPVRRCILGGLGLLALALFLFSFRRPA